MKKIILMTIACLFIFSTQAFAHTGLESSNPAQGSTVNEPLNEITLTYMTKIEKTSSFKLMNASNESMDIANLTVTDNVMTGTIEENLENGPYKIVWKIIGIDGHPIEGEVDFTLNAPVVEDKVEEPVVETQEKQEVTTEEVAEETPATETESNEVKEDKDNSTGLIIGIVVVLAAAVWFMSRRKNK